MQRSCDTDPPERVGTGQRGFFGLNRPSSTRVGALALAMCVLIGGTVASAAVRTSPAAGTTAGVKAARWGPNVKITLSKGSFTFRSNGIPSYGTRPAKYAVPNAGVIVPGSSTAHAAPDPTKAQAYDFTITTQPAKAAKPTSTGLGPIGVMISGAVLFNPYEDNGKTVALASNFTVKDAAGKPVRFLDSCNGHPTPQGQYHYHGFPSCISAKVDRPGGPSHVLGFAFDGYPIYGDRDMHGKLITAGRLEACNGIFSPTPEFPKGIYHYVLLSVPNAHSSIRCLAGKSLSASG